MEKLTWVKDIFGSKLEIRHGADTVGNITWKNMLSSKAQAMIHGRLFTLNREFFLSKLEIYDANDNALLGSVMINVFNPKSDVVINGKRFELEIKNFWQSKWSWSFNGNELVSFTANEFILKEKGDIQLHAPNNDELEILILLGLFVRNQFILYMLFFIVLLLFVIL